MERQEVYKAIESELDYQRYMEDRNDNHVVPDQHAGDRLLAIKHNLDLAIMEWYSGRAPFQDSMDYVRKIAALSVRLIEEHGCKSREKAGCGECYGKCVGHNESN